MQAPHEQILSSYVTSLEGRNFSQRHNAALALKQIDSKIIPAGGVFSFNQNVGSYSRDEGYRKAPVSFNGQLIDDWGGGVCQSSTTLYNAALLAGLTILERTHHRFCPSYVAPGRDAAVAYPSIDLKLGNPYKFPIRIHAFVDRDRLRVDLVASNPLPEAVTVTSRVEHESHPTTFFLNSGGHGRFVRNSGKAGYDAVVSRSMGNREEVVSYDFYPVMNRVIELR